jgi:2-keto-4-pentenoate hydratase/2-oxohepta-3-ene-1,7-dioic acid hydratase in catechol pathway
MRLISFGDVGAERPGVLLDDETFASLDPLLATLGIHSDMNAVLGVLPRVREELNAGFKLVPRPVSEVRLGPPVPSPGNLIAAGANTWTHLREAARHTGEVPAKIPMLIPKAVSSLCGPHDVIRRPPETRKLDYETELGVVIGLAGWRIPLETAMTHVAGYMVSNDITARDVQTGEDEDSDFYWQHFRGKSYPTFCPTGPCIVTADEVADVRTLPLQTLVNDALRQDSTVNDLIADLPTLISSISTCVPLRPGDVLVTGSPAGVGHFRETPLYLEPGDVLRSVIPGVGEMSNAVAEAE